LSEPADARNPSERSEPVFRSKPKKKSEL